MQEEAEVPGKEQQAGGLTAQDRERYIQLERYLKEKVVEKPNWMNFLI